MVRFYTVACWLIFIFLAVGIPAKYRSVNTIYVVLLSILSTSIALSFGTWFRLLRVLMKSPKSKIVKFLDHSSRLNETSLYRLRKEVQIILLSRFSTNDFFMSLQVSQLSYIIKTVEVFLSINTRLVVLIDGLDVCEQQRILQILDVNKIFINSLVDIKRWTARTCDFQPDIEPETAGALHEQFNFWSWDLKGRGLTGLVRFTTFAEIIIGHRLIVTS